MKAPTDKQIKKELAELKRIAPLIRQRDAFGGDNRAKIDAQIWVLEEDCLDETEIRDHAEEMGWVEDSDIEGNARYALDWLNGDSESKSLVENWKGLIQ